MVQIAVSGAYVKILYEKETTYGIPSGGDYSADGLQNITKILGHGIKVNSWSKDNSLRAITGINNVEPSAIVDGPFNGSISVEFDAIPDMEWLQGIMGQEVVVSTTHKSYRKYLSPQSYSFVMYINNDSVDAKKGDAFLLTGVIISEASFSIESGDNPVHVTLNCSYQTEYKYDDYDNIPVINSPTDAPFNYSMVNGYFWNPNTDVNMQDSFDSIESTIERLNFSIKHTATQIRGIGTRIPKDKVHANIEYEMSMNAVFRDPKKFLEKFYGCYNTPSKYIAPYEQIKIVIENFYRDSRHAKISFDFQNIKIKTHGLPLAIENVIMEDLTLLPIHCQIEVERGCPATPTVNVSPSRVEQGNIFYVSGANFAPGESINIHASFLTTDPTVVTANCLGELYYKTVISASQTPGNYTVKVDSDVSIPSSPGQNFEVVVTSIDELVPTINICKLVMGTENELFSMTGYNFTGSGGVTINLEKYNESTHVWGNASSTWTATVASGSITEGVFTYTNTGHLLSTAAYGRYRLKAIQTGVPYATSAFYVPTFQTITLSSTRLTLTLDGAYFPPSVNTTLIYVNGSTEVSIGVQAASSSGYLPGPTDTDTMVFIRSTPFTVGHSPLIQGTITGVNGGTFVLEKAVTLL